MRKVTDYSINGQEQQQLALSAVKRKIEITVFLQSESNKDTPNRLKGNCCTTITREKKFSCQIILTKLFKSINVIDFHILGKWYQRHNRTLNEQEA